MTGRPGARPVTPDTEKVLVEQYVGGASIRELVDVHNHGYGSVQRVLRRAGVLRRRGGRPLPFSDAERDALVAAYAAGAGIRELGRRMGRSYSYARNRLLDAGVQLRDDRGRDWAGADGGTNG